MNEFDSFCSELLEQSKRFYEKAKESKDPMGIKAFQNASLLLSICALEAYINGIAEEICLSDKVPINIKGLLLEKDVRFENGEFILSPTLKISRLTDKIELLYKRHTTKKLSGSEPWWPILKNSIDIRNKITHPKEAIKINNELLEKTIEAVLDCLTTLYYAVYKRKFPKHNLSLNSKFTF